LYRPCPPALLGGDQGIAEERAENPSRGHEAVRRIDELYSIERQISALSDIERTALREEKTVPILESLHAWATELPSMIGSRCSV
jgi:hypothetical protein